MPANNIINNPAVTAQSINTTTEAQSYAKNTINTNPRISGAQKTAEQLKIDPKLVDKAIQQLGADLVKELGPAYVTYLRAMSEALTALCSRDGEKEIKALAAQCEPPTAHREVFFLNRDNSSKDNYYKTSLPPDLFDKVDLAVQKGLLNEEQGEALKVFFDLPSESPEVQRLQQLLKQDFDAQHHQGEREGSRQGQGGHSGSSQEEENLEYDFGDLEGAGGLQKKNLRQNLSRNLGHVAPPPSSSQRPPAQPTLGGAMTPSSPFNDNLTARDRATIDQALADNPFYPSFVQLLQSENKARNIQEQAMLQMNQIKEAKNKIAGMIAGIDPSTPAGAKQLYLLQQKMGDLESKGGYTMNQLMEFTNAAATAKKELFAMFKEILDSDKQAKENSIRNFRAS